ncbi:ATP-binding protein [Helicobacter didelphidarum]|uniref:ATP-binding protein n=1 Tax=Helicobacter didelphidarum TaxID=2040648 RepID=A0A3D8IM61_9HELI|nr:HP0729 family protein [Helicobacter didelphidarum]RDU66272.1 ATP-binding protein [Helicobacter didelphidarum]
MANLFILYNPYYQNNVIEEHLKILNEKGKVAFGKVRSKLKDKAHNTQDELDRIYLEVSKDNPLQLFLSDYCNLFVAKVVSVISEDSHSIAPPYYAQKGLEVTQWFIITDMRELVRNDFKTLRDNFLANFITPSFGNHTYALYGNSYDYPLIIAMKQKFNYFDDNLLHYRDVYKSDEYLAIKANIITYSFGEKFIHSMHPNTLDNLISAEIEYQANKQNPLYDFSSVIVKYSKSVEAEVFLLIRTLFEFLVSKDENLLDISYEIQGKRYSLDNLFIQKANYGTYKYLLRNTQISESIQAHCPHHMVGYFQKRFSYHINLIQNVRNESVHEKPATWQEAQDMRDSILGLSTESIIIGFVKKRCELAYFYQK